MPNKPYVEYVHRACLACQKRIPRWTNGKSTPKYKRFCSKSCGAFWRRMHPQKPGESCPGKAVAENPKKVPINRVLLGPVLTVEGRPKYAPCKACGYSTAVMPREPTYCNDRCRSYLPKKYKTDGSWYRVAGPVEYCAACSMAIEPRQLPYANDRQLFCNPVCRDGSRKRKRARTPEFA
jgi:hypothetical protein